MWLNDAMSHVPLSNEGHISTMMDGTPSVDANGQLHQLQIHKLLQHGEKVVCPEGLYGDLEALQFTFLELPLWDATAPGEPFGEPWFLEVDLGHVQSESMTTTIQAPTTMLVLTHSLADTIETHQDITMAINWHLQGVLEWLQQSSFTAFHPCLPT